MSWSCDVLRFFAQAHARCNHIDKLAYATIFARHSETGASCWWPRVATPSHSQVAKVQRRGLHFQRPGKFCSPFKFKMVAGLNSLTFFQSHDQSTQDFCER